MMTINRLLLQLWLLCTLVVIVTYCHEGHAHQNKGPNPTSFNDPSFTQDEEHLKEHLKDEINMNKKMSPEEMEFHYFRLHDTNNDTHLDGTEIYQAMSHMMPVPELQLHEKLGKSNEQIAAVEKERMIEMQKYYEELIDRVLVDDDVDRDGYLTYSEFAKARRRDEYHQRKAYEASMTDAQRQQYEQFKQFQAMQNANQGQNPGQYPPGVPPPQGSNGIPPPPPPGQQQYQQQQYQQQQYQQQPGVKQQ